jgi:hypothetical protein
MARATLQAAANAWVGADSAEISWDRRQYSPIHGEYHS